MHLIRHVCIMLYRYLELASQVRSMYTAIYYCHALLYISVLMISIGDNDGIIVNKYIWIVDFASCFIFCYECMWRAWVES